MITESKIIVYLNQPKWVKQEPIDFDREELPDGSAGRLMLIRFGKEKDKTLIVDRNESSELGMVVAKGKVSGHDCRLVLNGYLERVNMAWGGENSDVKIVDDPTG